MRLISLEVAIVPFQFIGLILPGIDLTAQNYYFSSRLLYQAFLLILRLYLPLDL